MPTKALASAHASALSATAKHRAHAPRRTLRSPRIREACPISRQCSPVDGSDKVSESSKKGGRKTVGCQGTAVLHRSTSSPRCGTRRSPLTCSRKCRVARCAWVWRHDLRGLPPRAGCSWGSYVECKAAHKRGRDGEDAAARDRTAAR